ncbi:MAG TPA: hypothetical protein VHH73_09025 [Verrucomicrobiae bacterium]|nr:hypothetical protein [Verrucomicrobiae bacterium]
MLNTSQPIIRHGPEQKQGEDVPNPSMRRLLQRCHEGPVPPVSPTVISKITRLAIGDKTVLVNERAVSNEKQNKAAATAGFQPSIIAASTE